MSLVWLPLTVLAWAAGLIVVYERWRKRERARAIRHLHEYLTRMERW